MTKSDDKRVPVLRFKGFTDEWEQRKLGEICKVTKLAGFEFTKYVNYSNTGSILAIRGINVKKGKFNLQDVKYIDNSNFSRLSRSKLQEGDILFTYVGTIGNSAIVPKNVNWYLAPNVCLIRPQDKNSSFISYLIQSDRFQHEEIPKWITTSSQPALSMENIRKFKIILPLNSEQQKISSLVSKIDKLITLQQRKLKLLKLMKNIVSYNLVVSHKLASNNEIKWKAVYLKDIARIYKSTTITKKDLLPKGIPVFGANDYIGFYNKYNHETDQVTICARGASAGHPNYVKGPVWITGNSMVINVDETYINKKFLYTLLTFTDLKRFVTGGAQPQITRENLNSLKILLPSIKAQNNLSAIIENLSINIRKVQLSINSAKRLKQFLLQNMFI